MKKVNIFLTVSALIIATSGYSSTKSHRDNPLLTTGFNLRSQPSDIEDTVPTVLKVLKNLQTTTTLHRVPCTVHQTIKTI